MLPTLWAALVLLALPCPAAEKPAEKEKIVLRAANGRFLRAAEDGTLLADALLPRENGTFELISCGNQKIALKGPGGRFLTTDVRDRRTPRLGSAKPQPGSAETFRLVSAGEGRFAVRQAQPDLRGGPPPLLVFCKTGTGSAAEPVEFYRVRELPEVLKTGLPGAVRALANKELARKPYDKTRTHKHEKSVELPAPTLRDPKRKKQHQVLGLTEEYRVQAELDGQADIRLPAIVLLGRLDKPADASKDAANEKDSASRKEVASWKLTPRGSGLVLLAVEARLPVRGRVQYKLADVLSASTGYHATVQLSAVAQIRAERTGGDVTLSPAEVLDLHVSVSRMEFSNDILDAARRQIERLANHELRHNEDRIREKANRALHKALSSHEMRLPLLGYLGLL
jgi:hypothetical protein